MQHLLLVAVGGAIGSGARHLINLAALRWVGAAFPWGTLAVNILGAFFMGLAVELVARRFGSSQELRLFLTTGILGGFTTFSAFSLETVLLWQRGGHLSAAAYVAVSVAGSVAALLLGMWITRSML